MKLLRLMIGRTHRIPMAVAALLVPLHDPVRLAEDIAVLDLASGGRLSIVAGVGYRPIEFAAHRKHWDRRGELMDEAIATMLKAWTGEPFEYHGATIQVTPRPFTQPHPPLMIGGSAKVSARRAVRFGLPFFPSAPLPELEAYYYELCEEAGVPLMCMAQSPGVAMLFVHQDPDEAWAKLGHHLLHEATTYSSWQPENTHTAFRSTAASVEELRAEGVYKILTPDEAVAMGPDGNFAMHPFCGGMPIDEAWRCIATFTEQVMPRLNGSAA